MLGEAWDGGGHGATNDTRRVRSGQGAIEGVCVDSTGTRHRRARSNLDGLGQDVLVLIRWLVEVEVGWEGVGWCVLCTLGCRYDRDGSLDGLHKQPLRLQYAGGVKALHGVKGQESLDEVHALCVREGWEVEWRKRREGKGERWYLCDTAC